MMTSTTNRTLVTWSANSFAAITRQPLEEGRAFGSGGGKTRSRRRRAPAPRRSAGLGPAESADPAAIGVLRDEVSVDLQQVLAAPSEMDERVTARRERDGQ